MALVIEDKPVPRDLAASVHLFGFPRDSVQSVLIGVRCNPATVTAIKSALESHNDYRHVTLFAGEVDEKTFHLKFVEFE